MSRRFVHHLHLWRHWASWRFIHHLCLWRRWAAGDLSTTTSAGGITEKSKAAISTGLCLRLLWVGWRAPMRPRLRLQSFVHRRKSKVARKYIHTHVYMYIYIYIWVCKHCRNENNATENHMAFPLNFCLHKTWMTIRWLQELICLRIRRGTTIYKHFFKHIHVYTYRYIYICICLKKYL